MMALLLAAGLFAVSSAGCAALPPPSSVSSPAPQASSRSVTVAAPPAKDANTAVVIGDRQTFHSTILGEDRTVLVHTPASYKKGKEIYPVLYLLDADEHFHHTTGITDFLSEAGRAPEMIVVGIVNTADGRERDLTPTAMKEHPGSGGGPKFLSFLKNEVRPRIEGAYRTAPYRILVGHSLGGLFALQVLTSAPEAFDAYVAMSPSLWWDDSRLVHGAEAFFATHEGLQAFLYITKGNEPGGMLEGAMAFTALLKAKGPKGLQWSYEPLDHETHGSVAHRGTYNALEKLFTGWEAPPEIVTAGALRAYYEGLSKRFHFEVKLTEQLLNSFAFANYEKNREEAMAAFKLSVELHPDSPSAYDTLGSAYGDNGRPDLAKANFEIAVRKGTETSHPDLAEMKAHLERVSKPKAK